MEDNTLALIGGGGGGGLEEIIALVFVVCCRKGKTDGLDQKSAKIYGNTQTDQKEIYIYRVDNF